MTSPTINKSIVEAFQQLTGESVAVAAFQPTSGSSLFSTGIVQLCDHRQYFVKHTSADSAEILHSEWWGLDALAATGAIRVPDTIGVCSVGDRVLLIMERISSTRITTNCWTNFGHDLATLHAFPVTESFGLERDNFVGRTPQPNSILQDWPRFYRERRIAFQLRLAERNGWTGDLQKLGSRFLDRLDSLIPSHPRAALIHGDLWNGNFMCGNCDEIIIIDPAVYRADREAEFGMLTLFGSCPQRFFDAYQAVFPLESGWRERLPLYQLYHLLNHLNLFGVSYLESCVEILRRYV